MTFYVAYALIRYNSIKKNKVNNSNKRYTSMRKDGAIVFLYKGMFFLVLTYILTTHI